MRIITWILGERQGIIASQPVFLQLRDLPTLVEMAGERNATIIPLPLDLINTFAAALRGSGQQSSQ